MNTFQRLGDSPTGAYWCDVSTDADGFVVHTWRHATQEEAARLASPQGNPNHADYAPKLFGYEQSKFLARQYRRSKA